jgi:hypothetical protein
MAGERARRKHGRNDETDTTHVVRL